jgi:signal transduction histidine kinase
MGSQADDFVDKSSRNFFLFLNSYRWVNLILAAVLTYLKATPYLGTWSIVGLFFLVSAYNTFLTLFWQLIEKALRRLPVLLVVDIAFCGFLLGVYGWRSPFFLYSFSPLLLAGYLFGVKGGFLAAILSAFSNALTVSLYGFTWSELVKHQYVDVHISHLFDYFVIAVFFAYPAWLMQRFKEQNLDLIRTRNELAASGRRLAALQQVGAAIVSSLDLEETLKDIVTNTVDKLGFDRASIGLQTEENRSMNWLYSYPDESFCRELRLISQRTWQNLLASNDTLLFVLRTSNVSGRLELEKLLGQQAVIVPLRDRERNPQGLLVVDNHRSKLPMDERSLDILTSLAYQASIALTNARLYEHSQQLGIMKERTRLTSEIHDNVIQDLYGITLLTSSCSKVSSQDKLRQRIKLIEKTASRALSDLRDSLSDLYGAKMGHASLQALLREKTAGLVEGAGIELNFKVQGKEPRLCEAVKKDLCLICQEAISNAVRHAHAKQILVELNYAEEELCLKITDDGIGFRLDEEKDNPRGMGLETISYRATQVGACLSMDSRVGEGTKLILELPLHNPKVKDTGILSSDSDQS